MENFYILSMFMLFLIAADEARKNGVGSQVIQRTQMEIKTVMVDIHN